LVAILVIGLIYYLITLLPVAQPFKNIALVIVIVIAIVYLLGFVGFGGGPHWRLF
jgi:hypothetical protein